MRTLLIFVIAVVLVLAQGEDALRAVQRWTGIYDYRQIVSPVTSTERATTLAKKGMREQIISFDEMRNIKASYGQAAADNDLFAIGVGQITLNEPESRAERVVILGARRRVEDAGEAYRATDWPPAPAYGNFNNILLFDRKANKISKIFDSRISIFQFRYGWRTTPEVLIIFASDADTNANGVLDAWDKSAVYIYTLADRALHKIELPASVEAQGLVEIPDADYLVMRCYVERKSLKKPKSGETEEEQDLRPQTFLRIDLKTFKATPFVPPEMAAELQNTLDAASAAPPVQSPVEQPKQPEK
jgi:hypothetical protein